MPSRSLGVVPPLEFTPQRGIPCRNTSVNGSETCRVVAFFVFFVANNDSGKLYALVSSLASCQT